LRELLAGADLPSSWRRKIRRIRPPPPFCKIFGIMTLARNCSQSPDVPMFGPGWGGRLKEMPLSPISHLRRLGGAECADSCQYLSADPIAQESLLAQPALSLGRSEKLWSVCS